MTGLDCRLIVGYKKMIMSLFPLLHRDRMKICLVLLVALGCLAAYSGKYKSFTLVYVDLHMVKDKVNVTGVHKCLWTTNFPWAGGGGGGGGCI